MRLGGQRGPLLSRGPGVARLRRATISAGRAPGDEDEGGTGRGRSAAQDAVVQDDEPPIEELAHLDAHARIGAATPELDPALAERDGIVAGGATRAAWWRAAWRSGD